MTRWQWVLGTLLGLLGGAVLVLVPLALDAALTRLVPP